MALTDNLTAYWEMEDVTDSHSTYDQTNNGSVSFTSTGIIVKGASGFASGTYLSRASLPSIGTGAWSKSLWFRASSLAAANKVLSGYTGDENTILIDSSNKLNWYSTGYRITGATTISVDTWYHAVVVGNGLGAGSRNVKLYLNGSQEGSTYTADYNLTNTTVNHGIHSNGSVEPFTNGILDEIGFWVGKALSESEISELYNSGSGLAYPLTSGTPAHNLLLMGAGS